jgi:hypothetical protein
MTVDSVGTTTRRAATSSDATSVHGHTSVAAVAGRLIGSFLCAAYPDLQRDQQRMNA